MTHKITSLAASIAVATLSLTFSACNEKSDSTTSPTETVDCTTLPKDSLIQIITPKAGDSYKVGDQVVIKWKAKADQLSGVLPVASLDNGATWGNPLSNTSLEVGSKGTQCFEWTWTIPSDFIPTKSTNSQVRIRVKDYNDGTIRSTSDVITVSNP